MVTRDLRTPGCVGSLDELIFSGRSRLLSEDLVVEAVAADGDVPRVVGCARIGTLSGSCAWCSRARGANRLSNRVR